MLRGGEELDLDVAQLVPGDLLGNSLVTRIEEVKEIMSFYITFEVPNNIFLERSWSLMN